MTAAELYTRLYRDSHYGLKRATWGDEVRDWLLEHAPPPRDVLELGAGRGYMAAQLSRLGYTVTATEITEDIISLWPEGFGRRQCVLPAGAGAFDAESFDLVLVLDVLEHLEEYGHVVQTIEHVKRIARQHAVFTVGLTPARSGSCLPGTDENLHPQIHLTDWWCREIQRHFYLRRFYRREDCLFVYASKEET
jgi:SAM-dependent methyltransferase